MQIQAKIGGILCDRSGKLGSNYSDLEPGMEFWNWVRVPTTQFQLQITNAEQGLLCAYWAKKKNF